MSIVHTCHPQSERSDSRITCYSVYTAHDGILGITGSTTWVKLRWILMRSTWELLYLSGSWWIIGRFAGNLSSA